jgi:hypothetical protein
MPKMQHDDFIPDTRTEAERLASQLHGREKTSAERIAEGWRLSVKRYGLSIGNLRDGPLQRYRINPDGTRNIHQ